VFVSLNSVFANEKQKLNFKELNLELSAPKQELLLLEPIQIKVTLKSKQNTPIMADSSPDLSQNEVQLKVSFKDQNFKLQEISNSIASLMSYEKILTPERFIEYKIIPRKDIFLSAGEYSLQLIFYKEKQRLISNTLTINIVEPLGVDKEIFDTLKSLPNFLSLLDTPGISEEANLKNILQKITTDFPHSVYTPYIMFNLAESEFSLGDYDSASKRLSYLATKEDFPFLEIVIEHLKEIYIVNEDSLMADYYQEKLDKLNLRASVIMAL
jgi:hypothetical protein